MRDMILARFQQYAPLSVMMREAMEHALSPEMVDQVFEQHRQRQYSRELLFSTVVELIGLVAMGQSPSLHAAARKQPRLKPADSLPSAAGAAWISLRLEFVLGRPQGPPTKRGFPHRPARC